MAPATRAPATARARKTKPVAPPSIADLASKQKMMDTMSDVAAQGMLGPEESAWAQLLKQQHGVGERELGLTDSVKTIEVSSNIRGQLDFPKQTPSLASGQMAAIARIFEDERTGVSRL
jgi:hypothetical protein